MDAGRIVEQGSHAELIEKKGFYASLYESQFTEAFVETV
jgi:ABC-type multidrug transport system fused ATPase/permease subunit